MSHWASKEWWFQIILHHYSVISQHFHFCCRQQIHNNSLKIHGKGRRFVGNSYFEHAKKDKYNPHWSNKCSWLYANCSLGTLRYLKVVEICCVGISHSHDNDQNLSFHFCHNLRLYTNNLSQNGQKVRKVRQIFPIKTHIRC